MNQLVKIFSGSNRQEIEIKSPDDQDDPDKLIGLSLQLPDYQEAVKPRKRLIRRRRPKTPSQPSVPVFDTKQFKTMIDRWYDKSTDDPVKQVALFEEKEQLFQEILDFFNLHKKNPDFDPNYMNPHRWNLLMIFLRHGNFDEASQVIRMPKYKVNYDQELPRSKSVLTDYSGQEQLAKIIEKNNYFLTVRNKGFRQNLGITEYYFGLSHHTNDREDYGLIFYGTDEHQPKCASCQIQMQTGEPYFGNLCVDIGHGLDQPPECALHVECTLQFIKSIMADATSNQTILPPKCPCHRQYEISTIFVQTVLNVFTKLHKPYKNMFDIMKANQKEPDAMKANFTKFQMRLMPIILRPDIIETYSGDLDQLIKLGGVEGLNQKYCDGIFANHPDRVQCPTDNCPTFFLVEHDREVFKRCEKCQQSHSFNGRTLRPLSNIQKAIVNAQIILSRGKYQACPTCKRLIEKTEGCNNMNCGYCRFDFKWKDENHDLPYPEVGKDLINLATTTPTLSETLFNQMNTTIPIATTA